MLDDQNILEAIARAHSRGVSVHVIIAGKPYGMSPAKVAAERQEIARTGASVKYAPARFESSGHKWRFFHIKSMGTGHEVEIGSPNLTYAGLSGKDIDDFYISKNPDVVKAANMVYKADWNNTRVGGYAHRILVVSPGSQTKIAEVLSQPGDVTVEDEELGYTPEIMHVLEKKGAKAEVILPSSISYSEKKHVEVLMHYGVQVHLLPTRPYYLHAKVFCGKQVCFIGSENLSDISMNHNRELGIILNGKDVKLLEEQFTTEWADSQPFGM
jgi:phosphatidylserine/phosphatidylglycerophosphate/cardiolipin synthase-like enzyme